MLIDEAADRGGGGQEFLDAAAMQNEHHQFLALGAGLGDARGHDLVEIEPRRALRDVLQVVGIVVLAVDEDDFLAAAGDVQSALVQNTEIAGVDPAVGVDGERGRLGVAEIAARDARAADQNVPDLPVRRPARAVIRDAQFGVRNHSSHAHQFDGVARIGGIDLDARSDAELVPIGADPPIVGAELRERHRETGFRESIHRIHGTVLESGVGERLHEFVAQLHRDRLGAVVDRADATTGRRSPGADRPTP